MTVGAPDFQIFHRKADTLKQMAEKSSNTLPVVVVVVNIKGGELSVLSKKEKKSLLQEKNTCNIFYIPQQENAIQWEGAGGVEFFEIRMAVSALRQLLPTDQQVWQQFAARLKGTVIQALSDKPMRLTRDMKELLYRMQTPKFETASLQQRYIQCNVQELLLLLFDKVIQEVDEVPVSKKENALAEKACLFLDKFPAREDFTIISMAATLGTNETTLKQAFKKVLNTTIYAYYNKNRMEKASQLLREGHSITETTKLVGYRHASHFSLAFKKYHGVIPSAIYK